MTTPLTFAQINQFQQIVWGYYAERGRNELPWRQPEHDGSFDCYKIVVSEMMLQQTQVGRVIPKYKEFLRLFPSATELARAELGDVLRAWQGLGYNRRAKYIWQSAQYVASEYQGVYPGSIEKLIALPGIGSNTAGAICAYALNQTVVFVETNIRTVVIKHFFNETEKVSDNQIRGVVEQTLPKDSSVRLWYWALMDYGTHIKQTSGNLNKLSEAYVKQSDFEGSRRQIRGKILQAPIIR